MASTCACGELQSPLQGAASAHFLKFDVKFGPAQGILDSSEESRNQSLQARSFKRLLVSGFFGFCGAWFLETYRGSVPK